MSDEHLLEVNHLSVAYKNRLHAVRDVSFSIKTGETVGIVGESGSGKSTIALALLRLLPEHGCHIDGEVFFNSKNLLTLPEKQLRQIRGKEIGFIFQDALAALNPTMPIGRQIVEAILQHEKIPPAEAKQRALALMDSLGIDDPAKRYGEYPFQFSGGMRQRAIIAIAMACRPKLIIADEPTTALDESVQREILELLRTIQRENGVSILLISHDLSVIAALCHRVLVMKDGIIVESGAVEMILDAPQHPYTRQLLESARYTKVL